ncbi:hypothetical protein M9H77_22289 [Catharanthus roseus]|uniref:Uncharacterized protein n=1 Tax=Catharanthus roseus TaxID=4058 RepID=A0ACC0AQG5_CATRO|nr:hypothetical protein M9H77_22289 [Catharanthus roseus]
MAGEEPIRPRRSLALRYDDSNLSLSKDQILLTRVIKHKNIVYYTSHSGNPVGKLSSMKDIDEGVEKGSGKGGGGGGGGRGHNIEGKGSSRSLKGMGCVKLTLFAEQYNENLVKEFYANLIEEIGNPKSPTYGQVYVKGHVIDFSLVNIAHYLSYPPYNVIEGTDLEEKADFDEVVKVLIGDAGAVWPETNRLNSNMMKMPYRALFRERAHLLYAFATMKKINICTVIFRNILKKIDQKKTSKIALPHLCLISEYILGCRDLSLLSNSWVSALDPLVLPKIVAPSVVPLYSTPSTQGHSGPCRSTKQ